MEDYEIHFYVGDDGHHVVESPNNSPQLTYGTLRAADGGKIVAFIDDDGMWVVPGVGRFSDVVICVKQS